MFDGAIHAQHKSRLMSAPAEIRRTIYKHLVPASIHIFPSSQSRLAMSVCLAPPISPKLEGFLHDGYERRPDDGFGWERRPPDGSPAAAFDEHIWAARVRSPWGPHWECEEAAHVTGRYDLGNILSVCRKMFLDVCELTVKSAVVNITDLATLELLTREPFKQATNPRNVWTLSNLAYPLIRRLHVAFRLPLAFYNALERAGDKQPTNSEEHASGDGMKAQYDVWLRTWSAVCSLPKIRDVHIWLDHDGPSSWSLIRERQVLGDSLMAVLAAGLQARAQDKHLPPVEVLFNLPKLHPAIARPDTHFVPESPPSLFPIERRFRLRYYWEEKADGSLRATSAADFPITKILAEIEEQDITQDHPMDEDDIRKAERYETMLWEQGEDVYAYLRDVISDSVLDTDYI